MIKFGAKFGFLAIPLLLLTAAPIQAQEGRAPLFQNHAPVPVTIEAPLTTLMEERPDEEYLEGTFSYVGADGAVTTLDLKLRTRGNFRRQPKICGFSPIRLNFKKKQVKDTLFDGQDKLKLVTHCKSGIDYYQQLVLREYLAYRFLQVLTDTSFSARLFEITYVDTEGGDPLTRVGFVIEDNDDVADRLGMKSVKSADITHADLDPDHEALINLFQYMIGNTDYSLVKGVEEEECCHNSELLSVTGEAPYTPLPYDFDFAGMVNAPYAYPAPQFKLLSVRQRLYRGICAHNEILPATVAYFLEKQVEIYGIVADLEQLSNRSRKDVTNYLNDFFKAISKPRTVEKRFMGRCNETS